MKMRLKPLLERRGMTQKELAERTGLSNPFVSLLASGQRRASPDTLERLARELGVGIADLFDGAPGMAESGVAPWTPAPTATDEPRAAAATAMKAAARHGFIYEATEAAPSIGVLPGDLVVADLQFDLRNGDTVVATALDDHGGARTALGRWLPPWVIWGNGARPADRLGANGRVAINGVVVGLVRGRTAGQESPG
jgi:transcriptional regulator with XRE-family HTH domain